MKTYRQIIGAAVVLGALTLAPTASANPILRWLAQSAMPLPAVSIRLGKCPEYAEGTDCYEAKANTVWLIAPLKRDVLYHELGHAFDAQLLNDTDRRRLRPLLAFPRSRPWDWQGHFGDASVRVPPEEAFADAYALCSLGSHRTDYLRRQGMEATDYGWGHTPVDHLPRICALILASGLHRAAITRFAKNL